MAKKFFDVDEEENIGSKFNEASLQMLRIHKLQDRINISWLNPLMFYPEDDMYGYQIIFNSTSMLFVECYPKCKPDEIRKAEFMRLNIENEIRSKPIHFEKVNEVTKERSVDCNFNNWIILKEKIFSYNKYIRKLMNNHGLTTPDEEDLKGL